MIELEAEVVVVGCGPVGAVAANLLGARGIKAVVLEREEASHGMSRAISLDDEVMRIFQHAGLADVMLGQMDAPPGLHFLGASGQVIAEMRFEDLEPRHGYPPLFFFFQPAMERALREGILRFPGVALRLGEEVTAIEQKADAVTVTSRHARTGEEMRVRARYVIGCDGARSAVRRFAGIKLSVSQERSEPWLTVSFALSERAKAACSARLMEFVCDPSRPRVFTNLPFDEARCEFKLLPGETAAEMERPEMVRALLGLFVDPSAVRVNRAAIYTFSTAFADRFREGRVFLAGDAAHLMPPFMGQGMCSGIRDVENLTWKLAFALRGAAGAAALDRYEQERRGHTEQMAKVSRILGELFMARRPEIAWLRDRFFTSIDRIPRARRFIRHFEWKPVPTLERGLFTGGARRHRRAPEGTLFLQPRVSTRRGPGERLDEVLGPGFAVVGMRLDPRPVAASVAASFWASIEARFVRVLPAGSALGPREEGLEEVVDETAALEAWFAQHGGRLAVVRPDRFVFAVFEPPEAAARGKELKSRLLA